MYWKYIVKPYKTKLISQARRQVEMLKICAALNKEKGSYFALEEIIDYHLVFADT